ncbi:hypothetical protein [Oricola thermophila]|uniref:Uncharacterized protein n=1 Tax=Oricola thermophila TaxID=2742145 RepID=A0A6N1VDY5_9HYPH|nr:hypothetical protein [Oricola thermophila]QKV17815.1 hypothetical protein HTY61_04760 [Oricola thermophila]
MSAPVLDKPKQTRVRASKRALEIALDVLAEKGLSVEKLCVKGGQVEIHTRSVEADSSHENHGGLKQW